MLKTVGVTAKIFVMVLRRKQNILKGQFTQKWKFCHHLLTLMSFQTGMNFQENISENIFPVDHCGLSLHLEFFPKYFLLCSRRKKKKDVLMNVMSMLCGCGV